MFKWLKDVIDRVTTTKIESKCDTPQDPEKRDGGCCTPPVSKMGEWTTFKPSENGCCPPPLPVSMNEVDLTHVKGEVLVVMTVYVNVANLPPVAALAFANRMKGQMQKLLDKLPDHVGAVFLPTRDTPTRIEMSEIPILPLALEDDDDDDDDEYYDDDED